jgi:putative colanic acid biosysnthesis UDP-glucose lipid carrier transferase
MDVQQSAFPRVPLGSPAPMHRKRRGRRDTRPELHQDQARLGRRPRPISPGGLAAFSVSLMLADVGIFLLSFDFLRLPQTTPGIRALTPTLLLSAVILLGDMVWTGAYSKPASERMGAHLARVLVNCTAVFGLLLLIGHISGNAALTDWRSLFVSYLASLAGMIAIRLMACFAVERWRLRGKLARTVAVIDIAGTGVNLARQLQRNDASDLRFVGLFSREFSSGYRIDDLVGLTREHRIDDIILAAGAVKDSEIDTILEELAAVPSNVHVCTTLRQIYGEHLEPSLVFGHSLMTVHHRPLDGWGAVAKRLEDLLIGGTVLLLLLPLMGAIAFAIRLDSPGPVLFRQKRLGLNNTVFEIFKFRTMTHRPEPEGVVPQARPNDPRVTRVGRFLRRASLDELPQLFNVIRDEMSLVGPRPHAIPHNEYYSSLIGGYWARHRVRPGITGWAQVHGLRGETDTVEKMRQRVEFDLDYIQRWSLLLDTEVLLKTLIVCLLGRSAH